MKPDELTRSGNATAPDAEDQEQGLDEVRELDKETKRQLEDAVNRWAAERGLL